MPSKIAETDISAAKRPEWQQNGAFLAFPARSDTTGPVPMQMNAHHPRGHNPMLGQFLHTTRVYALQQHRRPCAVPERRSARLPLGQVSAGIVALGDFEFVARMRLRLR